MNTFARTDRSLVSAWWWTVDRWSLAAIVAICAIGAVLTLAASQLCGYRGERHITLAAAVYLKKRFKPKEPLNFEILSRRFNL